MVYIACVQDDPKIVYDSVKYCVWILSITGEFECEKKVLEGYEESDDEVFGGSDDEVFGGSDDEWSEENDELSEGSDHEVKQLSLTLTAFAVSRRGYLLTCAHGDG
ncbi:hypothetical protein RND81_03G209000 [Saponaria officinalis]|uniref:Uncharacterized protein n=1 Tax=Saponaria officinalis TaxID=3572 RepID=A0AAW1MA38_SAPOF